MRRNEKKVWFVRGVIALVLAVTFGYVPYHLYSQSGFAMYLVRRKELKVVRAENERIKIENERLTREAEALRSDLRTLERVARAELGWVRPGELLFDLGSSR